MAEINAAVGIFAEEKANEHAWDKNKRRGEMQKSTNDLNGNTIVATDGDIGRVDDFYFDDERQRNNRINFS